MKQIMRAGQVVLSWITVAMLLLTLTASLCWAQNYEKIGDQYRELAQKIGLALQGKAPMQPTYSEFERDNTYIKAANSYYYAAEASDNFETRTKIYAKSVRCYLAIGNVMMIEDTVNSVRKYAKDGGKAIMKGLSPEVLETARKMAKRYDNSKAYAVLSIYLEFNPKERNKLADEFNRQGNKDLAQMLNPALKSFDCKSMLTQADKSEDVEASLGHYAQYASVCAGMPASPKDCTAVFETAEATEAPLTKLRFYQAGKQVGCQVPEAAHEEIIEIIRDFASTPDQPGSKANENAANLGRTLLPAELVEREVPEVKVYYPGTEQVFELEAGEQTDHWITFPRNEILVYSVKPDDSGYFLVFDDGQMSNGMEMPPDQRYPKFRLLAARKFTDLKLKVRTK